MNYNTLKTSHNLDHNSCTVVASSLAFNIDYDIMLKHYDSQGRKRGRGVMPTMTKNINLDLAKKYNYEAQYTEREDIRSWTNGATMTIGNCNKYLPANKNYIIGVRGHSLAMVNGVIEDHTAGKRNRVISIMELTPPVGKQVLQPVIVESVGDTLSELTELMSSF